MAAVPAPRACRADHRRLCAGRARRAAAPARACCCGRTRASWPRPSGFVLLIAAGVTSYRLARRRLAYETWWSVHLYTYLALFLVVLAPGAHRRVVRRAPAGDRVVDGAVDRDARARPRLPRRRCRCGGRCAIGVTGPRRGAGGPGHVLRDPPRTPPEPDADRRRAVPAVALPASRPVVAGASRTRCRPRRRTAACGSPSRTSATTAPRLPRLRPGTRVAVEGPYGAFTADARRGDRVLLVGAGVGITPIRALLEELPERRRRGRRAARARAGDDLRPARRDRRGDRGAPRRRACTSSSGRASASADLAAGSCPTFATATSTSAVPTASRRTRDRRARRRRPRRPHIHHESFAF